MRYSDIEMHVTDIARYGFNTGKITETRISGTVRDPVTGFYNSSLFGVIAIGHTQTDSVYSVDVQADTDWVRSYRNDASFPATFTRTVIRDCNLQGTWAGVIEQVGDMQVPRYNVCGVTDRNAMPSAGGWARGTIVTNSEPAAGEPASWVCLTTGANNVLNADWGTSGQVG